MPEPLKADRRYMPGLDGLRAVAVLGVVAYHLGIGALPGGFLGVSVFFTLSGYLISDLILGRTAAGEFTLRSFWMARARRLLPAMLLMLVALMAWVTVLGPRQNSDFRAAAGTSSIYINNWWQVFRKISYFAQFDTPGALNHLWSLAIEEQFYIVWPLLLLVLARLVRESHQRVTRPRLGLCILGLATLSTVLMAVLFHPGSDPTRVYYGTDTRASELLVGAALAAVWPSEHLRLPVRAGARNMIDAAGAIGLLVIAIMFLTLGDTASFLYRGGFALLSLTTAVVVASLAHPLHASARSSVADRCAGSGRAPTASTSGTSRSSSSAHRTTVSGPTPCAHRCRSWCRSVSQRSRGASWRTQSVGARSVDSGSSGSDHTAPDCSIPRRAASLPSVSPPCC